MTIPDLAMDTGGGLLFRRWAAAWIDFIVVAGILVFGDLVLGNALYQRTLFFWLALALAYYPVLEALTGKTLGRLATGTIVVDEHGNVPGFKRAILRTIPRLIEVNPFLFGGIPAAVAVLVSKYHQRLGDMWAGTYVVRLSELAELRAMPPVSAPPVDPLAPVAGDSFSRR